MRVSRSLREICVVIRLNDSAPDACISPNRDEIRLVTCEHEKEVIRLKLLNCLTIIAAPKFKS